MGSNIVKTPDQRNKDHDFGIKQIHNITNIWYYNYFEWNTTFTNTDIQLQILCLTFINLQYYLFYFYNIYKDRCYLLFMSSFSV